MDMDDMDEGLGEDMDGKEDETDSDADAMARRRVRDAKRT